MMPGTFPILLVDDDPHIADLLSRSARDHFPEAEFIHVTSFEDASCYLSDLTGRGPVLVLLDINLNIGPSGLEFLHLIRTYPQGTLLPVIILSSSQEDADKKAAWLAGATAFTQKPDTYSGWKEYVSQLRSYWYQTATVPRVWFEKEKWTEQD